MKFSRKTKYVLLGLLVILNIILRLPVTPHEIGTDSFFTHALANSISVNGYAKWLINPLSFFGLYPFSYPSAAPFFLSDVSQCTSIDMEWTIWIAATFFGVLGMFTSYLMAKEINNDFLFAFSVAFVYTTSRMFIAFTNWQLSTRGFFIAILPLLIWSLLRCYNRKENRLIYALLTMGLLIILGTTHRIVAFIPLILIAFAVSILLYITAKKINVLKITPKVSIICFFALFIPLFLLPFTSLGFYQQLESFKGGHYSGYFFHGSTPLHIILNIGAEYAMAVGILIILAPIGLILLLLKKQKKSSDVFLLALVLCFAPFLADPTYMMFFILFIFSLLIGFGLLEILKVLNKIKQTKNVAPLILVVILSFSALLPYFVVVRPVPLLPMHTGHMNELTYDAALFIKAYGIELPRISDVGSIKYQINAIAGPPYYHGNINELDFWIPRLVPISEFLRGKHDYLYEVEKPWYKSFSWELNCNSNWTKQALDYKTHFVIEDNYRPNNSPFHLSLHETKPKIYTNGLESIWYLNY